ncbi:hypothetical protein UlMin_024327 [Ulmus minor]
MGSEPKTVPKLSLFSLTPSQQPEPSGMRTPPLRASASVPFLWEEAPGKPRENDIKPKNSPVRSLELPPRLLAEIKVTSPTTVLDGPEVGRSMSFTFSYRSPNESWGKRLTREKVGYFGSARWGSFRKNKEAVGGNLDFFSNGGRDFCGGATGGGGGGAKVKITRVRRRGSFLSISNSKAHFLASIYENIKQRVPWRRKQEKQRKMG